MFENSNISSEPCPICGKKLRKKPPCCSSKVPYLLCQCGYKKVDNETGHVHHSGGSDDSAGVQG